MQRERWTGTLEVLVGTPPHFALILLPITIAMATIGIYSLVATLLWGWLLFGIDLTIVHPLLFVASVPVTVLSFGSLGFLFAVCFVRFRAAWALGNMFEYPVWLVCGFLVPLASVAVAGLGAADLVGARPDLGDARDPRIGARRVSARRPRHVLPARSGVRASGHLHGRARAGLGP